MNAHERAEGQHLRSLSSKAAADWLMSTYPISSQRWGHAISLITHRSWQRREQFSLARYYLQKLPYANERIYEVFCSFMSISVFIGVIKEQLPLSEPDGSLLRYHLGSVLRAKAQRPADIAFVSEFLTGAGRLRPQLNLSVEVDRNAK